MSDHGHAVHAEPAASHDHHYEGEPADRPAPDEPKTPGWLPLLGIGLLLSGILGFVATQPAGKTREQLVQAAPAPSAAAPEANAAPMPEARPARPMPSGLRPGALPSAFPRLLGSGTPRRPGQFAIPGGSAPPRRPAPDPHAGHNHP
jgi:hypothetical protein